MKSVTLDDIRYTQQTKALNEIASKLGAVAYRPDYHGSKGDRNTVMFYTAEDEEHNRLVDQQITRYSRSEAADLGKRGIEIPDKCIYRDSFWNFENSDVNGLFNMSYANRGKINLWCTDWKEQVEGHIRLALARKRQFRHIRETGGWLALREADDTNNDLNREVIVAMKQIHGRLYLGNINIYDDNRRKQICSGKESVYEEYTGQEIYDFHCTFAVPAKDGALEEMIREWNKGIGPHHAELVDQIMARVDELGGKHFVWF